MKSNVCYNLCKSTHFTEFNGYTFYFSSAFNKNRFDTNLETFIENENLKLKSRYGCNFNAKKVSALHLYRLIEKRGFYVLGSDNCPLSEHYEVEAVVL